jgi:hypothetical protein
MLKGPTPHPSHAAVRFAPPAVAAARHSTQPAPSTSYGGNWPVQAPTPTGPTSFTPGPS